MFSNSRRPVEIKDLTKSLILAQDERWRRASAFAEKNLKRQAEAMGEAVEGYLPLSDKEEYAVSYKSTVRESIPAKEFKLAEPELYDKYRKVSESRTLRVAVKAPKRK